MALSISRSYVFVRALLVTAFVLGALMSAAASAQAAGPIFFNGGDSSVTEEATSQFGAEVYYEAPEASDDDGSVEVSCFPASGSIFSVGADVVECNADNGDDFQSFYIDIYVNDTTPPDLPLNFDIGTYEAASSAGAIVNYPLPIATDIVDQTPQVDCTPAPGTLMPLGETMVDCTASDNEGNQWLETYYVQVVDTMSPVFAGFPSTLVFLATSKLGAIVNYTPPTAVDAVDGNRPVNCSPASGSAFAIGTTTVTCAASDTRGASATTTFRLDVKPFAVTAIKRAGKSAVAATFSSPLPGKLSLTLTGPKSTKLAKPLTLDVAAGTQNQKLKLTSAAKRLIKKKRRVKATLTAVLTANGQSSKVTRSVTLRR